MRILVTGAAGQIGSTVARGLRQRHQVRGHDRVPMPELDDTISTEPPISPAIYTSVSIPLETIWSKLRVRSAALSGG